VEAMKVQSTLRPSGGAESALAAPVKKANTCC
jgi:hypothetical protein